MGTVISRNNMAFLKKEEITPQQMAEFMKNGAKIRSFRDILETFYSNTDLADRLTNGLVVLTDGKKDSVARNVRNWLNEKNIPQKREMIFQICYVLSLDEYAANRLLAYVFGTGIHYRNPMEMIHAYCLRTGKDYPHAINLINQTVEIMDEFKVKLAKVEKDKIKERNKAEKAERAEIRKAIDDGKLLYTEEKSKKLEFFTRRINEQFQNVVNDDELLQFFRNHGMELGEIHETAYQKFMEMLKQIQMPQGSNFQYEESVNLSMEEVVQEYIRMNVPEVAQTANFSVLQRLIKKHWPNEAEITRMRNRTIDVSRKVMILLYLITESFDDNISDILDEYAEEQEELDFYLEDEEEDLDTIWECRIQKMNLFLEMYGMSQLDLGSPFDLIVVYALKVSPWDDDNFAFASNRMEEVLGILFENVQSDYEE